MNLLTKHLLKQSAIVLAGTGIILYQFNYTITKNTIVKDIKDIKDKHYYKKIGKAIVDFEPQITTYNQSNQYNSLNIISINPGEKYCLFDSSNVEITQAINTLKEKYPNKQIILESTDSKYPYYKNVVFKERDIFIIISLE
jgi:hypothetical protein